MPLATQGQSSLLYVSALTPLRHREGDTHHFSLHLHPQFKRGIVEGSKSSTTRTDKPYVDFEGSDENQSSQASPEKVDTRFGRRGLKFASVNAALAENAYTPFHSQPRTRIETAQDGALAMVGVLTMIVLTVGVLTGTRLAITRSMDSNRDNKGEKQPTTVYNHARAV